MKNIKNFILNYSNNISKAINAYNEKTLDREKLWTAFTPQIFKKEVLFNEAINNTHDDKIYTDEASLVEVNGGKLKMIQGSKDNLKITLPEDIKLAKSILISHGRLEAVL